MIDLELFRKNPDIFKDEISKRGMKIDVEEDIALDSERRELIFKVDELRAQKNEASKKIPDLSGAEKKKKIEEMKKVNKELDDLEILMKAKEELFFERISNYPNITHRSVPSGRDSRDNVVKYLVGEKPVFDFEPKNHIELGKKLEILDEERAAKISGARFIFLKKDAVVLQFALVQYVLSLLVKEGFIPLIPPVLVKERAMYGTGFFPVEASQYYKTELDELFLVGTSEVPLCAYHSDEMLDVRQLPLKYAAFSTCFRREAGSYGKDLGGLFRVHQFDKIEMFVFSNPDNSWDDFEALREILEEIFKGIGLHYRIMNMCTGDIGAPNAKKYDLEAWMPGQENYREIASCSHDTEFQARRLNVKFKDGNKKSLVHTMNCTDCAIGRTIMAIMENCQDKNGNILIPEKLIPYMSGIEIIKKD